MMRRLGGTLVVLAIVVGGLFGLNRSVRVVAQDATPAADCPATSPEENEAIVEQYIAAFEAGDMATLDALLHDDFTHNLSGPTIDVPNEPGNADELAMFAAATDPEYTIIDIFAADDQVAVIYDFVVAGENVEGAAAGSSAMVEAIAVVRIECGMIAELRQEFDSLGLLLQLGISVEASGTPAA